MYSRSYQKTDEEDLKIPDGYDGNAFRKEEATPAPPEIEPGKADEPEAVSTSGFGDGVFSLFDKIPIGKMLSGFGLGALPKFKMPEIHGEEILIIALAAFLFFSKSGDRESALMLLLLLLF